MDPRNDNPYHRARLASGIRTAAFIVILGTLAVLADHAFFIAPRAGTPVSASPPVAVTLSGDGFALPDNLRPHAGNVAAPPPGF